MHSNTFTCADLTCNRLNPSGQVAELSGLVTKILQVFENVAALSLKEKWTTIALQVSLYMYVCMLPWKARTCTCTVYVQVCFVYCSDLPICMRCKASCTQ